MKSIVHLLALTSLLLSAAVATAGDEITEAEQRIFVDHHLGNVKPGTVLKYAFHQGGAPDASFDDRVTLTVKAAANNSSADARGVEVDFLSGQHRFELPALDVAESNPIPLYFFEMDVRDMHRALGGQEAYFRKRIRMALVQSAAVVPVKIQYGGHSLKASEISITPFGDDPLKERLKNFVSKRYVFTICPEVPGAIYRIETDVPSTGDGSGRQAPVQTVLTLDAG